MPKRQSPHSGPSGYKWTGERILETDPVCANSPLLEEHVARYRFAAGLVKGKKVLDAACGTGYGSDLMIKEGAREVIGIDISEEAIQHARRMYSGKGRRFLVMDASRLKLPAGSFDAAVSFETIEHLKRWREFPAGLAKALKKGGMLILSTPNRLTYSGDIKHNHFHYKEFEPEELEGLLRRHFSYVRMFYQRKKEKKGAKAKLLGKAIAIYNKVGKKAYTRPLPPALRKVGRHAEGLSADVNIHPLEKGIEPLYLVAVCRR
jgi:SAM-dependent methyltransferase